MSVLNGLAAPKHLKHALHENWRLSRPDLHKNCGLLWTMHMDSGLQGMFTEFKYI